MLRNKSHWTRGCGRKGVKLFVDPGRAYVYSGTENGLCRDGQNQVLFLASKMKKGYVWLVGSPFIHESCESETYIDGGSLPPAAVKSMVKVYAIDGVTPVVDPTGHLSTQLLL